MTTDTEPFRPIVTGSQPANDSAGMAACWPASTRPAEAPSARAKSGSALTRS